GDGGSGLRGLHRECLLTLAKLREHVARVVDVGAFERWTPGFEEGVGCGRRSEVERDPAGSEDEGEVEALVLAAGGLMDGCDDGLALGWRDAREGARAALCRRRRVRS